MNALIDKIDSIYPLPKDSLRLLTEGMCKVELPKNKILFEAGQTGRTVYFIERGIARAYLDGKDNQITFWFGLEGDFVFSYNSYINGLPGYESIELLENSVLYEIKDDKLQQLFKENIDLANWGRKLAERELMKLEERHIARLFKSASECYRELLSSSPALIQRIQLGYIASYLGVTQVTLSRIRAEMK
ncbi:MAG TPA: Crp/Fnr family transcriptional regulator [Pedobacter sp.]|uniref:Crp/Fnr family transcriptional regulator n=1 Tax=Pedobacter sp. TaxID=1411316 RepID=UPI002CEB2C03|nr:Crp/Fnr family transcriptional regulator [Pedobacter sp.]HMI04934.1 Crp/Fnr family transcriptional regulator [Pedobacter sp.]